MLPLLVDLMNPNVAISPWKAANPVSIKRQMPDYAFRDTTRSAAEEVID
jgi:hypothetical protein